MSDYAQPQDLAAEQAVLGAIMLNSSVLDDVADIVTGQDFYHPKHQTIHTAILGLIDRGEPVDEVTVKDALHSTGELERIGGASYLHTCISGVPHTASAGYYARIVADHAARRNLIAAADRARQLAYSGLDVNEAQDQARALFDDVSVRRTDGDMVALDDLWQASIDRWEKQDTSAMATGWIDLDRRLNGGLRPGRLTVIGARPSVGKSMLATGLISRVASAGQGVLMHSLEMSSGEVMDRVAADQAGVLLERLTTSTLTDEDWQRIGRTHTRTRAWPLYVDDRATVTLAGIRKRARDVTRKPAGLSLLVVDYLQLVTAHDSRLPRHEQVAAVSRGLKLLAKDLGIAVVALSQLNRSPEARADRRPTMSDLRESGAIEADADEIILLHSDPDEVGTLTLLVEKNRHGSTGPVELAWQPHIARASSLAHPA